MTEVINNYMNDKLPKRKNIRLKEYDYSLEGYYFITICTKDRKEILGQIKPVGVALLGDPKEKTIEQIDLKNEGKIVKKHINNCNKIFDNIFIDEYVIMPNHIHLIIVLSNGSPRSATPTIPKIINAYKSIVTKEIGYPIWQRNYYEHVIRNEKEYYEIKKYIQNNIINWEMDKYF